MQKNLIIAVLLSVGFLMFWQRRVIDPQLERSRTVTSPVEMPGVSLPVAEPDKPSVMRQSGRPFLFEREGLKVEFDSRGAGVNHWLIQENGSWVELVLNSSASVLPLETFPENDFKPRLIEGGVEFQTLLSNGIEVTKRLLFGDDSFLHKLEIVLKNNTSSEKEVPISWGWGPGLGTDPVSMKTNAREMRVVTYRRSPTGKRFRMVKVKKKSKIEGEIKWVAQANQYFLAAFILPDESTWDVSVSEHAPAKGQGKRGFSFFGGGSKSNLGFELSKTVSVLGRQTLRFEMDFYVGPKSYNILRDIRPGIKLEKSVGVGFLAKAALFSLYYLKGIVGNYGWAIVILTIILQIIMTPLTLKSTRHSARMKELQPKIKEIQERFKNDKQRIAVETMHLQKSQGVNMLGGCLPMLLQMPIFFALYNALRNAYELRGSPWFGWIQDLSQPDPLRILPVVMGLGMFLQQRLTAAPADPNQKMIMYVMPVMMTFMFLNFPAGLVLYWLTNSILTMIVQKVLMRKPKEGKA